MHTDLCTICSFLLDFSLILSHFFNENSLFQIIRRGNEANSLGSEVSKSSDGQNTEIDSSRQGKQVDDCNQQLENSGKLKRESGKIEESPAEDNKKANQTVVIRLLDQEDESKEFESEEIEAQLTSTNSSSEIFNTQ